jgi:signal transduction histidine kinase
MFDKNQLAGFIVTGTIVFSVLVTVIIIFLFQIQKKNQKHIFEKQQLQSRYQQELLQTQLEIQEQTLKTISQEIHDNIGQVLSLAKLNLNTMETDKPEELKEKIIDSKKLVSKAIQDLRDLSKSMNTDNIEALGLVRAVEYEMDMIRKTGFKTELNVEGSIIRLEPQKELILFRIIQEVTNNIIKHAEAASIEIKIAYTENELKIEVKDDGKGFDLSSLNENAKEFGIGIRNMHSRARLINADFNMNSEMGKGTIVSIVVPLNNHNL